MPTNPLKGQQRNKTGLAALFAKREPKPAPSASPSSPPALPGTAEPEGGTEAESRESQARAGGASSILKSASARHSREGASVLSAAAKVRLCRRLFFPTGDLKDRGGGSGARRVRIQDSLYEPTLIVNYKGFVEIESLLTGFIISKPSCFGIKTGRAGKPVERLNLTGRERACLPRPGGGERAGQERALRAGVLGAA